MKAQDGKVYSSLITGEILGNEIWLGCNDTAENYIEVEKPIDVEPIIPPEPIIPITPPEITISDIEIAMADLDTQREADKLETQLAIAELAEMITGGVSNG